MSHTCTWDGSLGAGRADDCKYVVKPLQQDCKSFSVTATSVRKVLLAASRISRPPCYSKNVACSISHIQTPCYSIPHLQTANVCVNVCMPCLGCKHNLATGIRMYALDASEKRDIRLTCSSFGDCSYARAADQRSVTITCIEYPSNHIKGSG